MSGFNPRNPTKYQGTDQFLIPFVTRDRGPTGADYRQPETGRLYVLGSIWQVGKNPVNGIEGDLWMLSKIVANVAYWIKLSTGGGGDLIAIQVQAATVPGTNPVIATPGGLMTVNGTIVANHSIPIQTHTLAQNEFNVEVQYAISNATSNAALVGLASFDSADFSVDANGFVTLAGGGSPFIGLTPDTGGQVTAVAGNINVLGQKAGSTVQAMQTVNTANNLMVEDRTWQTQYVVDASSTVGLRGTFTTIQAAINQAVTDGTIGPVIYVRRGTYVENINIPAGIAILIKGPAPTPMDPFQNSALALISGTATVVGTAYFENISVNSINHTSSGTAVYAYNSNFLSITSVGTVALDSCIFTSTGSNLSGGTVRIRNCSLLGILADCITIDSSATDIVLDNCHGFHPTVAVSVAVKGSANVLFNGNSNLTLSGDTTGTIRVQNCTVRNSINFPNATSLEISGVTFSPGSTDTTLVTQVPTVIFPDSQGNVLSRRAVTADGNVTNYDQYLGCNKAGALAISLVATDFVKGQVVIISDESGAAATNNITITPSAGLINGAATYVINANYGSVTLEFDGTNWFTAVVSLGTAPGVFHWTDVTGASQTIAVNEGYLSDNAGTVAFTLPATAAQFSIFRIVGVQGAWTLAQAANQQIKIGNTATTVGVTGSLASTDAGDCIECVAVVGGASTIWRVMSVVGNITVA